MAAGIEKIVIIKVCLAVDFRFLVLKMDKSFDSLWMNFEGVDELLQLILLLFQRVKIFFITST